MIAVLGLPATDGTGALIGCGRVGWPRVTRMLTGSQAAWAGCDGFRFGTPPESAPRYSHMRAWAEDWLARIRLDGRRVVAGVLSLGGRPAGLPPGQWRGEAGFREVRSQAWPSAGKRVGPLRPEVAGWPADLCLVTGGQPVTFVRIRPRAGSLKPGAGLVIVNGGRHLCKPPACVNGLRTLRFGTFAGPGEATCARRRHLPWPGPCRKG